MSASRYTQSQLIPQPVRKIIPAATDILHPLKMGERIDNIAYKYYKDVTLSWVIMCANPDWDNEFEIPFNTYIRVPFPLQRVFDAWLIDNEI